MDLDFGTNKVNINVMNIFDSDYMVGAHSDVLKSIIDTNNLRTSGYGQDEYTQAARDVILEKCGLSSDNANIYFFIGGTLTNKVLLDIILESYQAVISADSAHIFIQESGAIEALGHKVIALKGKNGKLSAEVIDEYMKFYLSSQHRIHLVEPGCVYITQPNELGALYTLLELKAISDVCKKYNLLLYIDGARLAYALGSPKNNVLLKDIAEFADCFYIGGAKCGALMGEAGVIKSSIRKSHFMTNIKRHGALFSKGRVVAVQFLALFKDDLYTKIGKIAYSTSSMLYDNMKKMGYNFYIDCQSNQNFVIFTPRQIEKFKTKGYDFSIWDNIDGNQITRLITDWTFTKDDIDKFLKVAKECV